MHDPALIRRYRQKAGLTQVEAARRADTTPQHWNDIESSRAGLKRGLSEPFLSRIAAVLGVEIGDLLAKEKKSARG